jgi:hypothetical protein
MSKVSAGALLVAALSLLASPAAAQICAGYPTIDRQFSFGGHIGFPEDASEWGTDVSYNFPGVLTLFGGLDVNSFDDVEEEAETFHVGIAADSLIPRIAVTPTQRLSLCPVVESYFTDTEFTSIWEVPIGLGIGTTLQLTPAIPLSPYVIPQLVIRFASGDDDLNVDSQTETNFGLRGGLLTGFATTFGLVFVGGEVNHLFVEGGNDPLFSIRAGITVGP